MSSSVLFETDGPLSKDFFFSNQKEEAFMALTPEQQTNVVAAFLASWDMLPGGYMAIFDAEGPAALADDPVTLTELLIALNPDYEGLEGEEFFAAYMTTLFNGLVNEDDIDILAEAFAGIEGIAALTPGQFAYAILQAMLDGDWSGDGLEAN
jgi:hypothetical protein